MMTRTRTGLAAASAAAALALAGCASPTSTASPAEAMEARLAQGTTIAVTLVADPEALSDPKAAAELSEMLAIAGDSSFMTLGVDPDGAVTAMSLLDAVEVRRIGDDVYLRVDWDRLDELDDVPLDPDQDPREAIRELGTFLTGAQDVATALAAGEWIGITDVGDGAQDLLGDLVAPTPGTTGPDDADSEELAALMEEYDLDSVDAFLDSYVTADGDNPWDLTIDGAALQQALDDIEAEASEAGVVTDMTGDAGDLPDTITGITMTARDGLASEVRIDLDEVGTAMATTLAGDDMADLAETAEAEPTLVLTMTDLGDNGGAPADATTIAMADLVAMMGKMGDMGEMGDMGDMEFEG